MTRPGIASRLLLTTGLLSGASCAIPSDDGWEEIVAREDARDADATFWEERLTRTRNPGSRARAARAAGRLRNAELAPVLQRAYEVEPDDAVREELVFAMGQVIDGDLEDELLTALADDDAVQRARGLEALAKHDVESASSALVGLLGDPDAEVRGQALLALTRLRGRRSPPEEPLEPATERLMRERILGFLTDADATVRWRAAYALAEIELDGRVPSLIEASGAADVLVRFYACMGLARLAGREEVPVEPMIARLQDPDPHVAATACVVLRRSGAADAVEALRQAARRANQAADFHVRNAALAALAVVAEPGDDETRRVVRAALQDDSRTVRGQALVTLARLDPSATTEVEEAARAEDVYQRMAAARAAAHLSEDRSRVLLTRLARDADSRVVVEALGALESGGAPAESLRDAALKAVRNDDLAIRGTGLTMLQSHGTAQDLPAVVAAFEDSEGLDDAEVRVLAATTAGQIAGAAASEFLATAIQDPSPAVQKAAADGLRELGLPVPEGPSSATRSSPELKEGRDYGSEAPNPHVVLHTDRGAIELELLREEAPHHVRSFLDLAEDGVYDGLVFHRVVTGFVVQGLDPRGDGWGTGGVFLRDEINPVPYHAGAVGMPNSGPDTGGCQIFITHVPTPHLDGRYTVFARVVAGMDVVHAVEVGDRCQRVELQ